MTNEKTDFSESLSHSRAISPQLKYESDSDSDISESEDEERLTYATQQSHSSDDEFADHNNNSDGNAMAMIDANCMATMRVNNARNAHKHSHSMRLKRRMAAMNRVQKMHVCNVCQPIRFFKKLKILEKHDEIIHATTSKFPCEWCGKRFDTLRQNTIHKRLYGHDKPIDDKTIGNTNTNV